MKMSAPDLQSLRIADDADAIERMREFFEESHRVDEVPLDNFCVMGGAPDPDGTLEIQVLDARFEGTHTVRRLYPADLDERSVFRGRPEGSPSG